MSEHCRPVHHRLPPRVRPASAGGQRELPDSHEKGGIECRSIMHGIPCLFPAFPRFSSSKVESTCIDMHCKAGLARKGSDALGLYQRCSTDKRFQAVPGKHKITACFSAALYMLRFHTRKQIPHPWLLECLCIHHSHVTHPGRMHHGISTYFPALQTTEMRTGLISVQRSPAACSSDLWTANLERRVSADSCSTIQANAVGQNMQQSTRKQGPL